MKKLLLSAAVAVIALTSVNAQEVKFGAKAGVNFANVGGDAEDFDARTSFHVGGVAEIVISEKFSVQPELLYSAKGAKEEYSESGFDVESTTKLDYLSIPIMAKYYFAEGFSVQAGPEVGFLLSAKTDYEISGNGASESGDEDVKDFYKGIDFGLGFGAGYQLESGLNFSARYVLGLSNIIDGEDSDDYSVQNNVIQISVGFMF